MLGERLKEIRKQNKIKQKELAEIIGVQKTAISLYESNKNNPSDKVKVRIARYFNVSLDYLMGIIDEPMPPYNKETFIQLPSLIKHEEKIILLEFIDFIQHKREEIKT